MEPAEQAARAVLNNRKGKWTTLRDEKARIEKLEQRAKRDYELQEHYVEKKYNT